MTTTTVVGADGGMIVGVTLASVALLVVISMCGWQCYVGNVKVGDHIKLEDTRSTVFDSLDSSCWFCRARLFLAACFATIFDSRIKFVALLTKLHASLV